MTLASRSMSEHDATTTSFTPQQNRAVLIAGLTCACFSVLATLVTLRWFTLMKRNFRHKLIMFLIFSDTFKAFWYFLFPVIVFARGPVSSSSGFCQATGFFLAMGIEASDFAILMIALHSLLYIFRPPTRSGDIGGVYHWRKWIYIAWVCFPLLAASLAFINDQDGYTTSGTFCYLPRRPFWYRLALSWIPRYIILLVIFAMYTAVYVYVTLKFRGFSNLQESESQYSSASQSRRSSMDIDDVAPDEPARPLSSLTSPIKAKLSRPTFSRAGSHQGHTNHEADPWDEVSFITSKGLRGPGHGQSGVHASDFAFGHGDSRFASGTMTPQIVNAHGQLDVPYPESRKSSHAPTTGSRNSQLTGTTTTTIAPQSQEVNPRQLSNAIHKLSKSPGHVRPKDPLKRQRRAIRKQLRYLFIYPALYVVMWIFPFASHCLLYNDYYVQHPIYWLTIVSTCMFSLQAGADCVVFSWREKPWRRISCDNKFSLGYFRSSFSIRHNPTKQDGTLPSIAIAPDEELGVRENPLASGSSSRNTSNHWWEAEGRKRKDSVWLGSDLNNAIDAVAEEQNTLENGATIPRTIEEERESLRSSRNPSQAFVFREGDKVLEAQHREELT